MEQLLKAFTHLAREIQVYFISGLLISLNLFVIDFFYYHGSLWGKTNEGQFIMLVVIVSYIFGHICMGFNYVLFELEIYGKKKRSLNEILYTCIGLDHKIDERSMPEIYKKNIALYMHFIERDHILVMMRWTISGALLINSLIEGIYLIRYSHQFKWQVLLLGVICFITFILLYILTARTEKDYASNIEVLKKIP